MPLETPVIAPEEPAFLVEPEALNAAVHRQVCSKVGLEEPVTKLGPFDICSHQLVWKKVVAPERVAEEVDEIQPVPFGADAGILAMLSGIGEHSRLIGVRPAIGHDRDHVYTERRPRPTGYTGAASVGNRGEEGIMAQAMTAATQPKTKFVVEGDYFEACSCKVMCSCIFLAPATEDHCDVFI